MTFKEWADVQSGISGLILVVGRLNSIEDAHPILRDMLGALTMMNVFWGTVESEDAQTERPGDDD